MNCQKVQSEISALSADNLSSRQAGAMLAHFASCPACQECWEEYQQLLFMTSTLTQPLPAESQSQQMWAYCNQRITETEIDVRYASNARRQIIHSRLHEDKTSYLREWLGIQPRWSWVALGGALAVLAGTWFVTTPAPHPDNTVPVTSAQLFPPSSLNTIANSPHSNSPDAPLSLRSFDASRPSVFTAPSPATSEFVDHRIITEDNPADSSTVSYTIPGQNP